MRRSDFPIFSYKTRGKTLTYLDSAATAQKPKQVAETMCTFLLRENAPVHRSLYPLGEHATARFEEARHAIADFLDAEDAREIVFTRNATESINVVAQAWGRVNIQKGDEIVVSIMEHHANFVPWLTIAKERGAKLRVLGITREGHLDLRDFERNISKKTKVVALGHVSNVLGTVNPIPEFSRILSQQFSSTKKGTRPLFVVDGAQSVPHMPVSVRALGCDAFAFSGHKLYGPTGIGVLWARRELLEAMPPLLTGGQMIREVTREHAMWSEVPQKFEAGSPDSAGAIGLHAAIAYLQTIGMRTVAAHERTLIRETLRRFMVPEVRRRVAIYGPLRAGERSGVVAFNVAGVHAHDVASLLAEEGVAIRAGHHCAMPLHETLGVGSSARVSFGLYNDKHDVDRFFTALKKRVLPLAA